MEFTKEQISSLICKHAEKKNGLHDIFEFMLESMMIAERSEYLRESSGNKGNGYRPGHTYGHGRREVLGIFNMPTESSTGWGDIFDKLKGRGVERVGLMVADGITGLDSVIGEKFPCTPTAALCDAPKTQHVRKVAPW